MQSARSTFVSNNLDLALTYLGVLVVLVVVYPVLNLRLLQLQ